MGAPRAASAMPAMSSSLGLLASYGAQSLTSPREHPETSLSTHCSSASTAPLCARKRCSCAPEEATFFGSQTRIEASAPPVTSVPCVNRPGTGAMGSNAVTFPTCP
jgi:hypothetical protein